MAGKKRVLARRCCLKNMKIYGEDGGPWWWPNGDGVRAVISRLG